MIPGFYFDDDAAPGAIVRGLIREGIVVETTHSAGLLGADDLVHLRYAALKELCLVTSNQGDFMRLHRDFAERGESHAGIVIIAQQRWGPGERIRRLLRLATAFSPDEMKNRLEFLSDWDDDRTTSP